MKKTLVALSVALATAVAPLSYAEENGATAGKKNCERTDGSQPARSASKGLAFVDPCLRRGFV